MTSRERTAYPVFPQTITPEELAEFYTPTENELAFVEQLAKGDRPRLVLTVLLKSFQKLGYLPLIQHVPPIIIQHIAQIRGVDLKGPLRNVSGRSRVRYRQIIHHHLKVEPYGDGRAATIEPIIRQAALTMSDPADLINVAIEQLILNRYELRTATIYARQTVFVS